MELLFPIYLSTHNFEGLVEWGLEGDLSNLHVNIRILIKNKFLLETVIISYITMSDIIGVCQTILNNTKYYIVHIKML